MITPARRGPRVLWEQAASDVASVVSDVAPVASAAASAVSSAVNTVRAACGAPLLLPPRLSVWPPPQQSHAQSLVHCMLPGHSDHTRLLCPMCAEEQVANDVASATGVPSSAVKDAASATASMAEAVRSAVACVGMISDAAEVGSVIPIFGTVVAALAAAALDPACTAAVSDAFRAGASTAAAIEATTCSGTEFEVSSTNVSTPALRCLLGRSLGAMWSPRGQLQLIPGLAMWAADAGACHGGCWCRSLPCGLLMPGFRVLGFGFWV